MYIEYNSSGLLLQTKPSHTGISVKTLYFQTKLGFWMIP